MGIFQSNGKILRTYEFFVDQIFWVDLGVAQMRHSFYHGYFQHIFMRFAISQHFCLFTQNYANEWFRHEVNYDRNPPQAIWRHDHRTFILNSF